MTNTSPTTDSPVRILIVDDHPIVREGLSSLLSRQPDFKVCGEAEDALSALKLIEETKPHVVTVDISLKGASGLDLIRRMAQQYPGLRLIVCSLHDEILYAERALNAGALGYVNKHEATLTIVNAVRRVLQRRIYLSDKMSERIAHRFLGAGSQGERQGVETLSDRELEVFQLIGNGLTTLEVAQKLNLGVKTIETHRRRIKEKLNIKNTAQLACEATHWILESNQSSTAPSDN